jgi:hypothetical protein
MGGTGATGAFSDLDVIFGKQNRNLDAGFAFVMPSNFIDRHDVPERMPGRRSLPGQKREFRMLQWQSVTAENTGHGDRSRLRFLRLVRPFFVRGIDRWDEKFFAMKAVSAARPVRKYARSGISHERRPSGLAPPLRDVLPCVNFCKKKSIQTGEKTKSRGRYTHPDVTVRDMLAQHGRNLT